MFFYDYYYIVLVLPMLLFSIIASIRVNSNFKKYSKIKSDRNITGAQAAQEVLNYYNINDVRIEKISGNLTDHFSPREKVIRLSNDVYDSTSIAAIGVACHEAGHAAQYAEHYFPIIIRNGIIPICSIGSKLGIPIAILGLIFNSQSFAIAGVTLFSLAVIFELLTLPVEFNASHRAIKVTEEINILNTEEKRGVVKVLGAAAMTYIASFAVSMANLLRLIFIIKNDD